MTKGWGCDPPVFVSVSLNVHGVGFCYVVYVFLPYTLVVVGSCHLWAVCFLVGAVLEGLGMKVSGPGCGVV